MRPTIKNETVRASWLRHHCWSRWDGSISLLPQGPVAMDRKADGESEFVLLSRPFALWSSGSIIGISLAASVSLAMIAWYKTYWSAMWSFRDDVHDPCVRASMASYECHKKPRQPILVQICRVTRKLITHVVWRRLLGGLCNVLPKRSVRFHHISSIPSGDTIWIFEGKECFPSLSEQSRAMIHIARLKKERAVF